MEILLDNRQTCNLTETNMKAFVKDGQFDYNDFLKCLRLATRHNLRITNIDINDSELPGWDSVQKRDRLLGVGLSSMVATKEAMGWTNEFMGKEILAPARVFVRDVADTYADKMNINRPLLVTTIKPSGSISLIPDGTSPGLHPPFAPTYIRRIEVSKVDGVAKALRMAGVPHQAKYSEIPDSIRPTIDPYSDEAVEAVNTVIFEFPVETTSKKTLSDYTALEQLDFYRTTMLYWTDHNSSCTITVAPDEVDEVVNWVDRNWDDYCGISFFPKYDGIYKQAPYEAITKERYDELNKDFPNLQDLEENLANIESSGVTFSDIMEMCENGACPAR